MYTRKNGRMTFRSNRRPGFKRNSNFSNGKARNKGTISQQYQKYLKFAKEAFASGDRVKSEYYYQFADHYSRLMLELEIVIDDNINNQDSLEIKSNQDSLEIKSADQNNTNIEKSIPDIEPIIDSKDKNVSFEEDESENESIESVSFISQPAKKKLTKTKKESV